MQRFVPSLDTEDNLCSYNNGGCSDICVGSASSAYEFECGCDSTLEDRVLSGDGFNCVGETTSLYACGQRGTPRHCARSAWKTASRVISADCSGCVMTDYSLH